MKAYSSSGVGAIVDGQLDGPGVKIGARVGLVGCGFSVGLAMGEKLG
jgi:hypothetical protein